MSDFGGVLTAPLLQGFARLQGDTAVPPEAFGPALARATAAAGGRNPLFELEVGAIPEAEFLATLERELGAVVGRPVTLHGFGERYMTALDANEELFAYYRALHARGLRFALLTNNVREWEPLWRAKLPVDEICETVVDSAFVGLRKPDPATTRSCSNGSGCRPRPASSSTISRSTSRPRRRSDSRPCTSVQPVRRSTSSTR